MGLLNNALICRIIEAMPFETGKAQIDEVLRQIRNGERKPVPPQPPDPMREMMEAAHRIGSRWGKVARRKHEGQ
jgi:polyhydroxyalkanoate synthesis regulator phasin